MEAFDVGAEGGEFLFDVFVAAVEVVDAADGGGAVGDESGDDEGGAGAQVAGHDGCAGEVFDALDDGAGAFFADICSHAVEFGDVHEAVGVDAFGDDADAVGKGEDDGHLGLEVGGEGGEGAGDEVYVAEFGGADDAEAVAFGDHLDADVTAGVEDGAEVFAAEVFDEDVAAGDGGGDDEGAGLDAVGRDGEFGAVEFFDAFDEEAFAAGIGDACAHEVEEAGEFADFGFAGGVFDDGPAFGEDGGGKDVGGAEDGGAARAAEIDFVAAEMSGFGDDVAVFDVYVGAEGAESFHVEVNGADADDAAAGVGDAGAPAFGEERAEDADGGAHGFDDVVRGGGGGLIKGFEFEGAGVGPLGAYAESVEEVDHGGDVAEAGDVVEGDFVAGEEGGGHDGEGGVFGAAEGDFAVKRFAAFDAKAIHCVSFQP